MTKIHNFVAIDWSGAALPVHNHAIAVATCDTCNSAPYLIVDEKPWSRKMVFDYIERLLFTDKKTLIGIDANFGCASAFMAKHFGKNANAFDLWRAVEKHSNNAPNFCASGFWQSDDFKSYFWTSGKQPANFTHHSRQTEIICTNQGLGNPESPFKLIGAKQVGKGGLSLMRMIYKLKATHGDSVAIWPFDSPFIINKAKIILCEIYPRLFIQHSGLGSQKIKSLHDLNIALEKLQSNPIKDIDFTNHQSDALISAAGLRSFKNCLIKYPTIEKEILYREGWIFGVA